MRLAFLFLFSLNSFAYTFTDDFSNGIYWRSFPINTTVYDGNEQNLAQLETLVGEAASQWEGAVGREIWSLNFSGNTSSGNLIRWSNNFAEETGFNPQTTLAVTTRYRVGTFFDRFVIILNGENAALRFNSGNILAQTILHELGHVIGLDHSEYSNAVMFASVQGVDALSFDDVDGANAAIDVNLDRVSTGFVSEIARAEESSAAKAPLACGTISFIDQGGKGGPGPNGGLFSLAIGFIFAFFLRRNRFNIGNNYPS